MATNNDKNNRAPKSDRKSVSVRPHKRQKDGAAGVPASSPPYRTKGFRPSESVDISDKPILNPVNEEKKPINEDKPKD
ncbi:MAG: hypothetical protein ACF8GE_12460 [Phycisphaerales bacterium JB043]